MCVAVAFPNSVGHDVLGLYKHGCPMKNSLSQILAATIFAIVCLFAAPSSQAADPFGRGLFDQNTMQGWQRSTGASAMVYGRLPFHPTGTTASQPHLGFAITAPHRVNGAGVLLRTSAPRFLDIRFNATDMSGGWNSALYLGSTRALTYDPTAVPGARYHNMFESGTSWVVVGLLGAAAIAGTFALTENGL